MSDQIIEDSYPLSPMQQGMVFHHLSAAGAGVDCEQIVCTLREPLELTPFRQAWDAVAARHQAIRTRFRWKNLDEPVQEVQNRIDLPWTEKDLRGLPQAAQREALASLLRADRRKGFDLTQAPLMRFGVLRMGDDHYEVLWSFHHILFDGRSFAGLLKEAFAYYEVLLRSDSLELEPAPPYGDHVRWLATQDHSRAESYWRENLEGFRAATPLPAAEHPQSVAHEPVGPGEATRTLSREATDRLRALAEPRSVTVNTLLQAAWALLLSRYSNQNDVVFGAIRACRHSGIERAESVVGVFMNALPVRAAIDPRQPLGDWLDELRRQELAVRDYEHTPLFQVQSWSEVAAGTPLFETLIVFDNFLLNSRMQAEGGSWQSREFWLHEETNYPLTLYGYAEQKLLLKVAYDRSRYSSVAIDRLLGHLVTVLEAMPTSADRPIGEITLLTAAESDLMLSDWNATETSYPSGTTFQELFERQVAATPEHEAVVCRDQSVTYQELNARANRLAHYLNGLGVGSDTLVGICVARSVEMVVAILGVLKAGGAYVPLDPTYPQQRLELMLEDSGLRVLLTQQTLVPSLPATDARVVCLDDDWPEIAASPSTNPGNVARPRNLAYMIYTSGSTGKPKGVMVEHRNVVNFFAGMDERIQHDPPGVWLAVTSLSFDISVLELLWTLARGFKVVIHIDENKALSSALLAHAEQPMDFSLFYFASGEGGDQDKYRLVLEGARFADRNGFRAVWTPERHFHAFGGLYPNPSVMAAALASITERVEIRAGSVVLPLHNPIRVAEEWSLVDNLSGGRVGIALASGWNPNDFVLRPETWSEAKTIMFRDLEVVRRLWRGETISFPGPKGDPVEIHTLPRPIQKELPIWITTAGNPDTYRLAGAIGANILTHLLGQTTDEVAECIGLYREALAEYGHDPAAGCVTMMLHTFVGDDLDEVRETVRKPMTDYLRSSLGLVKNFAAEWTAFKKRLDGSTDVDINSLSENELDGLLAYSFERYFETSGLFGTPARCLDIVDDLKGIGVDEIACLIDFGVDTEEALAHLELLNVVRQTAAARSQSELEDYSLAASIRRHGVTHLQCTPSTASMYLLDEESKNALPKLHTLMLGGEAFPQTLARELAKLDLNEVINMYGPTETTIWSSTQEVDFDEVPIPLGRPIANTEFYILDSNHQPVPVGVAGELHIGGDGVVRGYYRRPGLTAEQFVPHPFRRTDADRLYRTGDLARYRADGNVEFLGRIDHQVKIRGHRIELGEIETVIDQDPAVRDVVVTAREDVIGDQRLVAYLITEPGEVLEEASLRDRLREQLPEPMVPAHFIELESFPLTPNGKIDRRALPAPADALPAAESETAAVANEIEETIIEIWKDVLAIPRVSTRDNFFDVGGHSLLAVKAHRQLTEAFETRLSITDLFRFPTVQALAQHINNGAQDNDSSAARDRGHMRRASRARRRSRARPV